MPPESAFPNKLRPTFAAIWEWGSMSYFLTYKVAHVSFPITNMHSPSPLRQLSYTQHFSSYAPSLTTAKPAVCHPNQTFSMNNINRKPYISFDQYLCIVHTSVVWQNSLVSSYHITVGILRILSVSIEVIDSVWIRITNKKTHYTRVTWINFIIMKYVHFEKKFYFPSIQL